MEKEVILTSALPAMTPIIKIIGDWCNLKCDYCFYYTRNQAKKTVMNEMILEKFIKEYLATFNGHLKFTWHGGEPLLAGIPFFEKIIEFQEKYRKEGQSILNTIQTNGVLVDERWAEFLKKHHFRVGISIDGIKECHDRFRKDKLRRSVFNRVINGLETLQKNNVPVGVLHVLTHSNLSKAMENLNFFVNILKVKSVGSLIYYPTDNSLMKNERLTNEELTRFYKSLIDFWLRQNDPDLRIRAIENFVAGALARQASLCLFGGTCSGFFCLEYDGKIYPCDKFSGNPEFCWGNLSKQSLVEILNSKKRLKYAGGVNKLPHDCLKCKWQKACYNGCLAFRSSKGKYYYCKTRKYIFNYLSKIIKDFHIKKNNI